MEQGSDSGEESIVYKSSGEKNSGPTRKVVTARQPVMRGANSKQRSTVSREEISALFDVMGKNKETPEKDKGNQREPEKDGKSANGSSKQKEEKAEASTKSGKDKKNVSFSFNDRDIKDLAVSISNANQAITDLTNEFDQFKGVQQKIKSLESVLDTIVNQGKEHEQKMKNIITSIFTELNKLSKENAALQQKLIELEHSSVCVPPSQGNINATKGLSLPGANVPVMVPATPIIQPPATVVPAVIQPPATVVPPATIVPPATVVPAVIQPPPVVPAVIQPPATVVPPVIQPPVIGSPVQPKPQLPVIQPPAVVPPAVVPPAVVPPAIQSPVIGSPVQPKPQLPVIESGPHPSSKPNHSHPLAALDSSDGESIEPIEPKEKSEYLLEYQGKPCGKASKTEKGLHVDLRIKGPGNISLFPEKWWKIPVPGQLTIAIKGKEYYAKVLLASGNYLINVPELPEYGQQVEFTIP